MNLLFGGHVTFTNFIFVFSGLSVLSDNIKSLIRTHGGSIPLAALTTCYEAEFEAFIINNEEGVPLEHLGKYAVDCRLLYEPAPRIKTNFDFLSFGKTQMNVKSTYLKFYFRLNKF